MAVKRFNRPRLISFDDPAYQRHVAQMQLQRANQRAIRPPSQRDRFGSEVEAVVRSALESRFALSERRIVEYEERVGRSWQRKYRELDGVALDGQTRVQVFEIKASRRAGALHRALRQVRDTQAILKLAFPSVSASVVLIDTGILTAEEQAAPAEIEPPERVPQTLDEAIAAHDELRRVASLHDLTPFPNTIELVVLSVEELVALAGDQPLSLDWEADEADETLPAPPAAPFYSTPDEDDETPFAAALRKAAEGS
jgi:hypothetical protein